MSSLPHLRKLLAASLTTLALNAFAAVDPAQLPPPATHPVDFAKEIRPLFEATCIKCHGRGKDKGGFSIETRASFLKGGDSGDAAAIPGQSAKSPVIEMVAALDPENTMPKKGQKWSPEQVGLLRAWIDQGAAWPEAITFAKPQPQNLHPQKVELPAGAEQHPIDRLLTPYLTARAIKPGEPIDDLRFVRRAYLDAIGLLPTPAQTEAFVADPAPGKRAALVQSLLANRREYAGHWLSFWNDLLRNDYRGTGFIDGGRKQISGWLYDALLNNKPYGEFVRELVDPSDRTLGFTAGIIWRGTVPAAMTPPLQAAQSVSQVFLGINLKCASCHDSFVSDWSLADAYGMAAVFSDKPMELVRCDKPTGQKAAFRFLYPELGKFTAAAERPERLHQLASFLTAPENGRLSRTLVNRLWARLMGYGLVEPVDDMDQKSWSPELLDWLAEDFVAHGGDLQHTIATIMTSRAYALPAVEGPRPGHPFVFSGPLQRRLSAEQFADAVHTLVGNWPKLPSTLEFDWTGGGAHGAMTLPKWVWTSEPLDLPAQRAAWRAVEKSTADAQAKIAAVQALVQTGKTDKLAEAGRAAEAASAQAAAVTKWALGPQEATRHRVIFRKHLTLTEKPAQAYATLLASQTFEVAVNGATIKAKMTDGFRNGRVKLFDFASQLRAGENIIAISVDSHSEKQMTETERKQFPSSAQHLNPRPGMAFYLRCRNAAGFTELVSDESWRVRRAPEGAWGNPELSEEGWAAPSLVAKDAEPIDEGPGLEPLRRQDFANIPVPLGPPLRPSVSTAALAGHVRASMVAADPLQSALDRPNREIVIPARSNAATTLQALELTNGVTLANELKALPASSAALTVDSLYRLALSRPPTAAEAATAAEMLGQPMTAEGVADLLWALMMLPEFQFIP